MLLDLLAMACHFDLGVVCVWDIENLSLPCYFSRYIVTVGMFVCFCN